MLVHLRDVLHMAHMHGASANVTTLCHPCRVVVCAVVSAQVATDPAHLNSAIAPNFLFWQQPGQPGQKPLW